MMEFTTKIIYFMFEAFYKTCPILAQTKVYYSLNLPEDRGIINSCSLSIFKDSANLWKFHSVHKKIYYKYYTFPKENLGEHCLTIGYFKLDVATSN
ncbi:hypothetical protein GWI33_009100 [Rhynchophorus ferrugineus]|uniref:Uncharacterized protein n=1 Tax=Rhynchophorus ferrugineus TaxID=354439 RepID=A0A834MBR3_RHYFE|nr:hypothetical protein GWI33_009100 [Rhynchophorus ferrugineus]